jgi:(p)ppGpp synthase/HD superfamily hydrolase
LRDKAIPTKEEDRAKSVGERLLSTRFDEAFVWAHQLHSGQRRKGTPRPYIGHLMGVAALVLQYGGDEDQAIAALLHDAVEDCGGKPRLEETRQRFGEHVAAMVDGCTDAYGEPKPPWRARKEAYVARIAREPADVRLVSAADKLHNVREILSDYRNLGEAIWSRFQGGREGSLWYYRAMVVAFRAAGSNPLIDELDRAVTQLETLAAKPQ